MAGPAGYQDRLLLHVVYDADKVPPHQSPKEKWNHWRMPYAVAEILLDWSTADWPELTYKARTLAEFEAMTDVQQREFRNPPQAL